MKAIILNTSGHKCPDSVIELLRKKGYERYSMYNCILNYDLVNEDIWQQVEGAIKRLARAKDRWGQRLQDNEGDLYVTVPALSVAAVMLVSGISKLFGIAPTLLVITRVGKKSELTQHIDLRAWESMCRTKLRKELLLTDIGQELVS